MTSLGSIFAPPTPVAFGTQTEDLSFEYTQTDGSIRTGVVNYLGTYGVNNLVLRVDPTTARRNYGTRRYFRSTSTTTQFPRHLDHSTRLNGVASTIKTLLVAIGKRLISVPAASQN